LAEADTGFETSNTRDVMNGTIVGVYEFPLTEGYINVGVVGAEAETGLEYPDDGGFHTV
jgi:hypothetical protein